MIDLRCCDCMDLMAECEDKSFDLAVVDPPFGLKRLSISENNSSNSKNRKSLAAIVSSANKWNHKKPDDNYFKELFRISKNQIIWGANNFMLPPSEYFCIWNKQQTVPNFASAEYAWVSMGLKKPAKVFTYSIHKHNAQKGKIHPTQKPVKLYQWIFANYAEKGQRVFDSHLGSGSSAIAAHYAGLDFVGCELDKDYFDTAKDRVDKCTRQQTFDF
jgi:site-specific DNA-methyltransferase (adenine-specific)